MCIRLPSFSILACCDPTKNLHMALTVSLLRTIFAFLRYGFIMSCFFYLIKNNMISFVEISILDNSPHFRDKSPHYANSPHYHWTTRPTIIWSTRPTIIIHEKQCETHLARYHWITRPTIIWSTSTSGNSTPPDPSQPQDC